ncbi:MAG: CFI-box-CTERM domain-containing protein [Syntrophales bacterium]
MFFKKQHDWRPTGLILVVFALIILFTAKWLYGADIKLAWDPVTEADVSGYRIYYGTSSGHYTSIIDAGNQPSCVVTGLDSTVTYYFAATAYDQSGNESGFSNEVVYAGTVTSSPSSGTDPNATLPSSSPSDPVSPSSPSSSSVSASGGGGGCFIATAAFGSYLAPEVMVLRDFRDRHLLTNAPGRYLVRLYYRTSPPVADFIAGHENWKSFTRVLLIAVIFCVKYPGIPLIIFGGLVIIPILRRRGILASPSFLCTGLTCGKH